MVEKLPCMHKVLSSISSTEKLHIARQFLARDDHLSTPREYLAMSGDIFVFPYGGGNAIGVYTVGT